MLKYPFKFHQKDWLMYTDSDTADRAWGPIPTTYISIVLNDILRFVGNKQISFMPAGEIVCGAAAVLSNSSMYLPPEQEDMPTECFTRGTRCIKMVHPDKKLRKYIRQIGEKQNAIDPEGSSNFKMVIDDKPLTPEERKELIKKVGKKPSWDNISKLDK